MISSPCAMLITPMRPNDSTNPSATNSKIDPTLKPLKSCSNRRSIALLLGIPIRTRRIHRCPPNLELLIWQALVVCPVRSRHLVREAISQRLRPHRPEGAWGTPTGRCKERGRRRPSASSATPPRNTSQGMGLVRLAFQSSRLHQRDRPPEPCRSGPSWTRAGSCR